MAFELEDLLPINYNYTFLKLEQLDNKNHVSFDAIFRVNIETKLEAEEWLVKYEAISLTNFRVSRTFYASGNKLIFKRTYHCHHNTRPNSSSKVTKPGKNTNCSAYLTITINNKEMKRSKDCYLKTLPTKITLHHHHNHPIKCAEALHYRKPSKEIKEKFIKMFENGHSPATALQMHKFDLQEEAGDKYFEVIADGNNCPNLQWCFYLYYTMYQKTYRDVEGEQLVQSLKNLIQGYNVMCGSVCAAFKESSEGPIVAICSPLMKRIHSNIQECSELMFVDSLGSMDRQTTKLFLFLTPSLVGALPLGMLLTYSESEEVLTEGLSLWRSILPEDCFYGNQMPKCIVTGDCASERNALIQNFPGASFLLSKFHVLQTFWRYLWNSSTGVLLTDRAEIFEMFKAIVNADSSVAANQKWNILQNALIKYTMIKAHLEKIKIRIDELTLAFRANLNTLVHNTNNYAEDTCRVLRDIVLNRRKSYSIVQVFDFVVSRFDSYFERRIINVVNNRSYDYQRSMYYIAEDKLTDLQCIQVSCDTYTVFNEKKSTYNVDIGLGICSCPIGVQGILCNHQYAVYKIYNISTQLCFEINDIKSKETLMKLVNNPEFKYEKERFASLENNECFEEVYIISMENDSSNNALQETGNSTTDNVLITAPKII